MAKSAAVWGIDIGRCALKALRCRLDGNSIVADGFDYIEYPKLLTQPEADAPQLIKEALEQFLTRNSVKGDRVAIAVSGESGLARYFKPPPVDVKKIADIVKYEARQQIPFALEDVIWDYQRMAGGQEVDGFALDTEIGLFAMKREQVAKAMQPYNTASIEVDVIQLAPIAIYNYIAHDVAKELGEGEEYSSDTPPPSLVVLSIGTDTTDLVVTNGYRVWQRNIPLGGNHFTKQLSKELKLTFAKAEHLKRNPKQAEDPKAIFQAMRPVFADMVTEVQRSIGFFQSLDRKAKINGVVMLGNTVKLPGLVQYLSKHLGYEVQEVDSYNKLTGASVVAAPSFKDNVLAFSTCYGLCLQGLGKGKLSTNLLPREILTQRLIRAKKPWAVAGVAAMVLACALNYVFYCNTWKQVAEDTKVQGVTWKEALASAQGAKAHSDQLVGEDTAKVANMELLKKIGHEVVGSADRRVLWLEVMKAINKSLPAMAADIPPNAPTPDPKKLPFMQRKDLKIEYVETQFFQDLSLWFNDKVKTLYLEVNPDIIAKAGGAPGAATTGGAGATPAPAAVAATPATGSGDGYVPPPGGGGAPGGFSDGSGVDLGPTTDVSAVQLQGPTGPGWVVEIKGHHFYNDPKSDRRTIGALHVRNTLIKELEHGFVEVPLGPGMPMERFSMKELGIGFAILAHSPKMTPYQIYNPNYLPPAQGTTGAGFPGAAAFPGSGPGTFPGTGTIPGATATSPGSPVADPDNPEYFPVMRYDFAVQFVWQEKPLSVRLEERQKKAAEAAAAAVAAPAATPDSSAPAAPPAGQPGQPAAAPAAPPPAAAAGATAPVAPGTPPGVVPVPGEAPVAAPGAAPGPGAAPPVPVAPVVPEGAAAPQAAAPQAGAPPAAPPPAPVIPEAP
jgi:type IV pilus assembly protein PilM